MDVTAGGRMLPNENGRQIIWSVALFRLHGPSADPHVICPAVAGSSAFFSGAIGQHFFTPLLKGV